jgi:hypothetical protein
MRRYRSTVFMMAVLIARSPIQPIWRDDPEPGGIDDWRSRRVTVLVEP